jgi:phage gp36-like protein
MSYITVDEFILLLDPKDVSELSDDASGGSAAEETIQPLLDQATGVCDSYIAVKYTTPLANPSDGVKFACTRIASYFLHLRRPFTVSESVKEAYDEAIKWLEALAAGDVVLPIPPASQSPRAAGYFGGESRIFQGKSHGNTCDKMHGF